jgi:hypothetical protein
VRLTRSRKILATGAGLLGIMLGAAGIAAATTGTGGPAHRSPAVHAQQPADPNDATEANDTAEANDTPDVNEKADHEQSDTTEHDAPGSDAGQTQHQG